MRNQSVPKMRKSFGASNVSSNYLLINFKNVVSLTLILFIGAHWYLYAIGMCREEESNSIAEMGYNVSTR